MTEPFKTAFLKTMEREGWGKESNHPADPGGRTFCGISERYWPEWEGWALLNGGSREAAMNAVEVFYRVNFWNQISGYRLAELSSAIAEEVFDTCVNVGVGRGAGYLQEALNLLNLNQVRYKDMLIDGQIGPKTIDTLRVALAQRPPTKEVTERRILRIINVLHGALWVDRMRKYPDREEFRGIWDRV